MYRYQLLFFLCLFTFNYAFSQKIKHSETDTIEFQIPDPLISVKGTEITNCDEWLENRPALINLFEEHVYGKAPADTGEISFEVVAENTEALGGKATRREVAIRINKDSIHTILMLMYLPNIDEGKIPMFLGLNFKGNHSVSDDPEIIKSIIRVQPPSKDIPEDQVMDFARGEESSRWPLEQIIDAGYGVATIYRGDIDPDYDDGFQNGIHPLFYKNGQTTPKENEWGTIAAWSWGLSRAMDYLTLDADVDESKVIVVGHSRLGKAALWAGALDTRFAMVVSNNSGCVGASLSRHKYGETVFEINKRFPHWFCQNFKQYSDKEELLPIDQHQLIALIAPRPVYIASASEDSWADPTGEFLSAIYASPVYELFGMQGLTEIQMPKINTPIQDGYIGYHIREGKHDITSYDWAQYITFANKYLTK